MKKGISYISLCFFSVFLATPSLAQDYGYGSSSSYGDESDYEEQEISQYQVETNETPPSIAYSEDMAEEAGLETGEQSDRIEEISNEFVSGCYLAAYAELQLCLWRAGNSSSSEGSASSDSDDVNFDTESENDEREECDRKFSDQVILCGLWPEIIGELIGQYCGSISEELFGGVDICEPEEDMMSTFGDFEEECDEELTEEEEEAGLTLEQKCHWVPGATTILECYQAVGNIMDCIPSGGFLF